MAEAKKKKRKKKKKKKKPMKPWVPLLILGGGGILALIVLIAAVLHSRDKSLADLLTGTEPGRMEEFREVVGKERQDLLYLTYLDSLARNGRALPGGNWVEIRNVIRLVAEEAGISPELATEWGFYPPDEGDHGELNEIFREMYRKKRITLPMEKASLWTHVRDRKVHPGYIAFGQTALARGDQIDFCGVLTAVNWLQPEYTVVLYRDPRTRRLVHGDVKEMPQIAYFGSGRPGNDLGSVYQRHLRLGLENLKNRKPLFPRSR